MNCVHIEARDLSDAWFQSVFKILDEGRVFKIDRGSYAGQKRLEYDWFSVRIKHPGTRPLLPQIESHFGIPNPVEDGYLDEYLPYLMTPALKPGESYTYGQRISGYPVAWNDVAEYFKEKNAEILIQDDEAWKNKKIFFTNEKGDQFFLNSIEMMIWTYKNKGYRNNQMVLQVAHPTDMRLQDPPCLRLIDTRIQDGKLHFFPYFRSWDLWNGFPANLGGIQLLKEYCASEIGVEDGEIIAASKGLHVYDYVFDMAKLIRMREDMELKDGDNLDQP